MKLFTKGLKQLSNIKIKGLPYRRYRFKNKKESVDIIIMSEKSFNTLYNANLSGYDYIISVYGFPIGAKDLDESYIFDYKSEKEVFRDPNSREDALKCAIKYVHTRVLEDLYMDRIKKKIHVGSRVKYSFQSFGGKYITIMGTVRFISPTPRGKMEIYFDDYSLKWLSESEITVI